MKIDLLSKIEERSAKIGIIGLGYVGFPLALRFCEENLMKSVELTEKSIKRYDFIINATNHSEYDYK